MTPKEEAKEIFDSFEQDCTWIENFGKPCVESQKNCAIICVEKITDIYVKLTPKDDAYYFLMQLEHYEEVINEIKNIQQ